MPRRAEAARGARRRPWKPEPAPRRRPGGRVVSRTGLRGPAVTGERRVPPNGKGTRRATGLSAGGTAPYRESGDLEDFRIARSGTRMSRGMQASNTGATAFQEHIRTAGIGQRRRLFRSGLRGRIAVGKQAGARPAAELDGCRQRLPMHGVRVRPRSAIDLLASDPSLPRSVSGFIGARNGRAVAPGAPCAGARLRPAAERP